MLVANVATSAGFWLLRSVQVRSQIARPPVHCLQDGHRGHTSPLDIVDIVDIVDTHVFEVCCIVEVGDVDAGPGRGVRPLHPDQLRQLQPPQLLLGGGAATQKYF